MIYLIVHTFFINCSLCSNAHKLSCINVVEKYDFDLLDVPPYSSSSRGCMFQLQRPNKHFLEDEVYYETCRLASLIKTDVRETS